jgi:HD-like signal output (HDOD) protein
VAALLLTTIGALAIVARHQQSAKLNAQRKLATASDQLNAASQELGRTNGELATAQSSLADTQTRAQTAQDTLGQVKAAEVDAIAPYLVDESTTLDEARCIVNGVIDRLGVVPVLRYNNAPPPAQMPPELERAIDQAAAACVPDAPTA